MVYQYTEYMVSHNMSLRDGSLGYIIDSVEHVSPHQELNRGAENDGGNGATQIFEHDSQPTSGVAFRLVRLEPAAQRALGYP